MNGKKKKEIERLASQMYRSLLLSEQIPLPQSLSEARQQKRRLVKLLKRRYKQLVRDGKL